MIYDINIHTYSTYNIYNIYYIHTYIYNIFMMHDAHIIFFKSDMYIYRKNVNMYLIFIELLTKQELLIVNIP